jgi:hypothetical protein
MLGKLWEHPGKFYVKDKTTGSDSYCRSDDGADLVNKRKQFWREAQGDPAERKLGKGGLAIERSPRATPVVQGARSLTIGVNHQHPRNMNTPNAGLKQAQGDDKQDTHLELTKLALTV